MFPDPGKLLACAPTFQCLPFRQDLRREQKLSSSGADGALPLPGEEGRVVCLGPEF